jgi:hypothetical protein
MNASLCKDETRIDNMLSGKDLVSKVMMTMKIGNILVFKYNTR